MTHRIADYIAASHSEQLQVARLLELAKDYPSLPSDLVELLRQLALTQQRLTGLAAVLGIPLSSQPTGAGTPAPSKGQGPAPHRPGRAEVPPSSRENPADHAQK